MIAIMFFIPIYNVTETTRCNGNLNCNIIGASGIARRRRKFLGFYIHFFQIPLYFGRFRTAKSLTETGIHPSKPGSTKTGVHQTGVHQSRLLRKPRSTKPRSTKIFRKNRGPWTPVTPVNRGPSTTLAESLHTSHSRTSTAALPAPFFVAARPKELLQLGPKGLRVLHLMFVFGDAVRPVWHDR